jgi:hypothetical protein
MTEVDDEKNGMEDAQRPQLRPVEVAETQMDGKRAFVLNDPSTLGDSVVLSAFALAIAARFDGQKTVAEIAAELSAETESSLSPEAVAGVAEALEDSGLLCGHTFYTRLERRCTAFRSRPHRPACLAGESYPADPQALRTYLDGFSFCAGTSAESAESAESGEAGEAGEAGEPLDTEERHQTQPKLVGALIPHIDFARGGDIYATAYREIARRTADCDVFVILGVDHKGPGQRLFTVTRLDYDTPLGRVRTHKEAVDWIIDEVGPSVCEGEWAHEQEHSVEFQAVWLAHVGKRRKRPFTIVPVLCNSFARFIEAERTPTADPEMGAMIDALRQLDKRYRCCFIVSADLAHMGPAFGDDPLSAEMCVQMERDDRQLLELVASGAAEPVFDQIATEKDRRKICGLPPLYVFLRLFEKRQTLRGHFLGYIQCPADAQKQSWVSIAAMLFATKDR